jgi:hypothetical protein
LQLLQLKLQQFAAEQLAYFQQHFSSSLTLFSAIFQQQLTLSSPGHA